MQDRELVAAIVAGDPGALAEAYDRYGAPLYTYCRSMLPDPHPPGDAADVVADTFIIATAKLQQIRDPGQLGAWLDAVARNECLRQIRPVGPTGSGAGQAAADARAAVSPPAGLRERVLKECADNTPTGRAHRVSVTHRAGPFGRTGYPKPIIPPGPRWWHEVRRHPQAAAGVAAVAAAVLAAGTTALLITGSPHRTHASTIALGSGDFATSGPASGGQSTPDRKPGPTTSASAPAGDRPNADPSTSLATARSPAPTRSSRSTGPSRPPSPSPSPSPPPTPGTLRAGRKELALTAVKGKPASGTFTLAAVGGPVKYVITSSKAKVTVSPRSGSLGSAGSRVTVTVTVRSQVAVKARVIVNPGDLIVAVVFSIEA